MMDLHNTCGAYPGLLEEILSSLQQVVVICDPEGLVLFANKATEAILGHTPEEFVGLKLARIFTKEDMSFMYPNLFRLAATGQNFQGDAMLRRKGGVRFMAQLVMRPFQHRAGGPMIVVFCLMDIDRQKNFEQTVRETRFEDMIKIANGIAHEIRNPLVGIGGFAGRLHRSCQPSENNQKYYDYIVTNLKRIENLVKKVDYLVSLPQAHFRPESVNDLIDEAVEPLHDRAWEKKVVLGRDMEEVRIYADRELAVRAIGILTENAIDAVTEGGRIVIHGHAGDDTCEIRVSDNGPGIDPEDQPFVFNPFFTTKPTGAGIDLAVVRRIMECHRGAAGFTSTPGDGATFYLHFPVERRREIRTRLLE
jgi:PAS domain S-box-containing protein